MVVFTTMSRLGRCARLAVRPAPTAGISTSAARSGGAWAYRALPPAPPNWCEYGSHAILTITWWWIFHGLMTEPAHIFPFWDNYPEPEDWTDEQLGIPPDDE